MKLIHTADIHLGSKINTRLDDYKAKIRQDEVLHSFDRLIQYAKENDIKVILLAGDIFDSDNPRKQDKDYFCSAIKNNPDIDFIYLRGNHDNKNDDNKTYYSFDYSNLKTFDSEWNYYEYNNIRIYGKEIHSFKDPNAFSSLELNENKFNIVMAHGDINDLNIKTLKNKYIDYLALGHIHSYIENRIDDRGVYVYPGCLEGRGFDELGEKGFVEIDIKESVERYTLCNHKFISFSQRIIEEINIDITGIEDIYAVKEEVKNIINKKDKNSILKVNLTGESEIEIDYVIPLLKGELSSCFYLEFINKVKEKFDISKYKENNGLISEFINIVNNEDYSEEEKERVIKLGVKAITNNQKEIK